MKNCFHVSWLFIFYFLYISYIFFISHCISLFCQLDHKISLYMYFLWFYLLIDLRERKREQAGGGREKSRLFAECWTRRMARSHSPKIMTRAEIKRRQPIEPPRCPSLYIFLTSHMLQIFVQISNNPFALFVMFYSTEILLHFHELI